MGATIIIIDFGFCCVSPLNHKKLHIKALHFLITCLVPTHTLVKYQRTKKRIDFTIVIVLVQDMCIEYKYFSFFCNLFLRNWLISLVSTFNSNGVPISFDRSPSPTHFHLNVYNHLGFLFHFNIPTCQTFVPINIQTWNA